VKPVLIELGPFRVHAYGLALALSFLIGSLWVNRRGRKLGFREEELNQLFLWVLGSALIGSRIYYALQHPEDFRDDWLEVFRVWRGGLTQYGGLIGALVVGWLYVRSRRWSFRRIGDLLAPALALGEAITRIGCLLSGCCYGRPAALPWCVHYPPDAPAAQDPAVDGLAVHPSPLYLSLGNLALAFALARAQRWGMRPGRVLALYLGISSLLRYGVDITRHYTHGDRISIAGASLAHSQWVGLLLLGVAAAFWFLAPREGTAAGRPGGGGRA
jgi:phosphatidylglycerol:prolipoprotein diacylglycerol transferase